MNQIGLSKRTCKIGSSEEQEFKRKGLEQSTLLLLLL
jgi:hypothetical protein